MKSTLKQCEADIKRGSLPPVVLIYGDDAGAVRQAALAIQAATGVDVNDAFACDRIQATDLLQQAGKLLDAAQTVSMLGGLRLVKLEGFTAGAGKELTEAVTEAAKDCLAANLQEVVVLLPCTGVDAKSALARAVEGDKRAAAIRCFHDKATDIGTYAQNLLQQAGKRLHPQAKLMLQENLGADRDVTRQELEKLITYMGEKEEVEVADVLASLSHAPAADVFKLCDAVGLRDAATAHRLLHVLLEEGEDANMLFTMVLRHLRRLLQVHELAAGGMSRAEALRALIPPVMFGQDGFLQQLEKTTHSRLKRVVERALAAQFDTRDLNLPPEEHLVRVMVGLAV
ncbi:MAG: DNA polymerase III subunit delta [Alphaproteobacteria bacterium]